MSDHRAGAFSLDGGVTEVVSKLTGAPAEDFETTARRYAAMPFAQQTLSNRLAAFARFNLLPFHPGHDLSAYGRRMRFSRPGQTSLSSSDKRWLTEHVGDVAPTPAPPGGRNAAQLSQARAAGKPA